MSRVPRPLGSDHFFASPKTPGPLGHNDAADPRTPEWFVGDTPGPLGYGDYGDPKYANTPKFTWSNQDLLASNDPPFGVAMLASGKATKVVLTSRDKGWYQWAEQFTRCSQGRALARFESLNPDKNEIIRAYRTAAGQVGPGGMLIISAGHGGASGSKGWVDLAPGQKLLISSNHFAHPAGLLQAKDRAVLQTFTEIGSILKNAGIAETLLISCCVGNAIDFLQEIADRWGVTVIGYRDELAPYWFTLAGRKRRWYICLKNSPPKLDEEKQKLSCNYPPPEPGIAWHVRPAKPKGQPTKTKP